MPAFKILIKLNLRILTGLVIKSLIITTTKIYIRVYTHSLIKGLIGKKYSYSLYCGAAYVRKKFTSIFAAFGSILRPNAHFAHCNV